MLPFEDGETTGDVALLEDNIVVEESGVLDGPGCGLGNDVPKYNVKCHMIQYICICISHMWRRIVKRIKNRATYQKGT